MLSGVKGIAFVYFDEKDVVRHRLVQAIIRAYEALRRGPGRQRRRAPATRQPSTAGTAGGRAAQPPAAAAASAARGCAACCEAAARALRVTGEVSLVLTGDRAVRALNARYRGKDKPTDVLSFPGGGGEAGAWATS